MVMGPPFEVYEKVGDDMKCSPSSILTAPSDCGSDGWSGLGSIDTCMLYCSKNRRNTVSCPRKADECKFVQWSPSNGGCHLADGACKPSKGVSFSVYERKSQGKMK